MWACITLTHYDSIPVILAQTARGCLADLTIQSDIDEETAFCPGPRFAEIRGIRVGEDAISPNRHLDIGNNQELLGLIARIRDVTGKPVGFKAVIGAYGWLDELFRLIEQRGIESAPDFITVDSADGGTGAAPLPLIDDMGLPSPPRLFASPPVSGTLCRRWARLMKPRRLRYKNRGQMILFADMDPGVIVRSGEQDRLDAEEPARVFSML
jgi:hypothetical protein